MDQAALYEKGSNDFRSEIKLYGKNSGFGPKDMKTPLIALGTAQKRYHKMFAKFNVHKGHLFVFNY